MSRVISMCCSRSSPTGTIDFILSKADRVYCANVRNVSPFAVAEAYRNWYDLDEQEVLALLVPQPDAE